MSAAVLNKTLKLSENDTALKYSEKPDELKRILADEKLEIKTEYVGTDFYFDGDNEKRAIIRVYILRNGKKIDFRFGLSIVDTNILHFDFSNDRLCARLQNIGCETATDVKNAERKLVADLLYSVLCSVKSEYSCDNTFEDFCCDFGYDTDSRKAFATWQACLEQSRKLQTIFTQDEINCFPD